MQDSQNLTNIFKLDFGEGAEPSSSGGSGDAIISQNAASAPRQAIFSADDLANEEDASSQAAQGKGLFSRFSSWRAARSKQAAEHAFEKAYGGASGNGGQGGPRAAVYTGQMGASQKRASRIQSNGSAGIMASAESVLHGFTFGAAGGIFAKLGEKLPKLPEMSRGFKRGIFAGCCSLITILLAGSIYVPAQHYYQQIRERDRLSAEYSAVQERNEALQSMVDRLSTDEGLEDKAHAEFGLIKPDEETASVIGIEPDTTLDFKANIAPGSVPAPETWYSGVLDVLFFYDRG